MNGWQRVGVAVTGFWILLVCIYAGYERSRLDVNFLREETGRPIHGYARADELYFIDLSEKGRDEFRAVKLMAEQINSTSQQEKDSLNEQIYEASTPVYSTTIRPAFWLVLLVPAIAGWGISYIVFRVARWISIGFK